MSQRATTSHREALLKSYTRRLKDDVKSIMDNYTEIIKTAKVVWNYFSLLKIIIMIIIFTF